MWQKENHFDSSYYITKFTSFQNDPGCEFSCWKPLLESRPLLVVNKILHFTLLKNWFNHWTCSNSYKTRLNRLLNARSIFLPVLLFIWSSNATKSDHYPVRRFSNQTNWSDFNNYDWNNFLAQSLKMKCTTVQNCWDILCARCITWLSFWPLFDLTKNQNFN